MSRELFDTYNRAKEAIDNAPSTIVEDEGFRAAHQEVLIALNKLAAECEVARLRKSIEVAEINLLKLRRELAIYQDKDDSVEVAAEL